MNSRAVDPQNNPAQKVGLPASKCPVGRIVVLLPDNDLREAQLAQRLSQLATQQQSSILLVSIYQRWADEADIRLRMALLVALLRDTGLSIDIHLTADDDWLTVARAIHQKGDLTVCFAEHECLDAAAGIGARAHPIADYLTQLHFALCELSGYVIATPQEKTWQKRMWGWLLPLTIVVVMFVFQVALVQWTHNWDDWAQKSALIATVLLEIVSVARLSA